MENRFDELAKSLAGGVSRREALRRFAGGLAGALLASLGLGRRAFGQALSSVCEGFCRGCGVKPGSGLFGPCVSSCEDCVNASRSVCSCPAGGSPGVGCCSPPQLCCSGVCCRLGQACCSGACVDTAIDNSNCGSCGHACPSSAVCSGGQCCPLCNGTPCCPPDVCVVQTTSLGGTVEVCTLLG